MKIALSSDHAGFALKEEIKSFLVGLGHNVEDLGTYSAEPVDYPDFTFPTAEKVASGECPYGIVCCGTGQGNAMVANKVPGIRAALCWDTLTARLSREHNNANMLVLSGWMTGSYLAKEIVKVWLETPFDGGRHSRRLEKMVAIEKKGRLLRRHTYDVTRPIYIGMRFEDDPAVEIEKIKSLDKGDPYNLTMLHLGSHSGTHIDAPAHFFPQAKSVDELDLGVLLGPAYLYQMPKVDVVGLEHIGNLKDVTRLLLGVSEGGYISSEAASYIVSSGVKLVGVSSPSVDPPDSYQVHYTLLGHDIAIVEGLELSGIPAGEYELICLPLKIEDVEGAPVRVLLREL